MKFSPVLSFVLNSKPGALLSVSHLCSFSLMRHGTCYQKYLQIFTHVIFKPQVKNLTFHEIMTNICYNCILSSMRKAFKIWKIKDVSKWIYFLCLIVSAFDSLGRVHAQVLTYMYFSSFWFLLCAEWSPLWGEKLYF